MDSSRGASADARVVVVGPGRAGGSLVHSLLAAGVPVPAVATRDGTQHPFAERLGLPTCRVSDAAGLADVVVLAVPDDAVAGVAGELAAAPGGRRGRPVVTHLSGALGLEPLSALAATGFPVAAWHLLQAFPSSDTGVGRGIVHAVTTDGESTTAVLSTLVEALGGRLVHIAGRDRARYHAAAVLAANGTAAVMVAATRQLRGCGLSEADALAALDPLVDSARQAVSERGIPDGLTGPWMRGDTGTVARHLAVLADDAATVALYRALARVVGDMASDPTSDMTSDTTEGIA